MRKKLLLIIVSITLIFSLTGCFPNGKKALSEDNFIDDLAGIPKELHETLSDNLMIDAKVIAGEALPRKTYKATLKEWDKETVKNIFLANKQISTTDEIPNDFDANKMNYFYTTEDSASLGIQEGSILFDEKKAIERQYTAFVKGYSFFIDYNLKENFPKEILSNVDKESSIDAFKNICDKLGVTISEEPEVYALDAESLDAVTDYEQEQPNGKVIEKWTEEEQVYFIAAHVSYENFPMTQFGYMTQSNYGMGTRLYAFFGVDGLIQFSLNSFYEIIEQGEEVSRICSLDTANHAIKEKYKNTILSNPVKISEIRLEYVPVQKDQEKQIYEFTPMWIYTVSQDRQITKNDELTEVTEIFQIYVNALTGVEFDIGGSL